MQQWTQDTQISYPFQCEKTHNNSNEQTYKKKSHHTHVIFAIKE